MTQAMIAIDALLGAALPALALVFTGLAAWRAPEAKHDRVIREANIRLE